MDYAATLKRLAQCRPERVDLAHIGAAGLARLGVDLLEQGRSVALVVGNREQLLAARALLALFTPRLSAGTAEDSESGGWAVLPPFTVRSSSREGWAQRLSALYALRCGRMQGVVLTADNLLPRFVPTDFFEGRELRLNVGEEISPDMVLEQAVLWGYERVPMVSNPGEAARRGDILDIFPPGCGKPLRLDFFGDVLEEIRIVDPTAQRSLAEVREALLLPVHPARLDAGGRAKALARFKRLFQKGLLSEAEEKSLAALSEQADFRLLPGAFYDAPSVVEEWLPKDVVWLLPSDNALEEALEAARTHWKSALEDQAEQGRPQPYRLCFREPEQVAFLWERCCVGRVQPLRMGVEKNDANLPERDIASFSDLFPTAAERERPWQTLVRALKDWKNSRRQVVLCFASVRSRDKFLKLAAQDGFAPLLRYDSCVSGLFALVAPFRRGIELIWDNVLVLGEDVIQPHTGKARRVPSGAFRGLDRYDELNPGDPLVHRDYGIARFSGLVRMEAGGAANDFLILQYAGDDKLYVPVDRLSLIQRFKGGDVVPSLDRLGGGAWQSGKEKARKAVEKIAGDLVEMYAWRKLAKGFRYDPPGELYREFEATFGFEETPDQARAIQEVLADMEKPEPMDRLVCGDVGFGKTEVALRAAFRAASESRQVALLCPTTILAEQHYQSFRARLAGFPVNVGLLSRFVPPQKQKETLRAAASGQIDILIGTHRLLSDDVRLPNLGLLILDEEQRFGVRHKEKLKKLKKNIDALTLTATPIPRTLQLSLSGVRELSVIETAPPERKPVSTAIVERDKAVLHGIVERELQRQGQVFWVYNRVQGLDRVAEYVRELVPQARVGIAHGQLPEKELEETMHRFWHGELDILVCTAIVESGLDFPRANTLIVDQAQMFGLGQLYQLRGRVGRSDRQAFAVFVVSEPDTLQKTARERLRIILDLDYLGAGFQVAMEDLRLRGAGNILGEVQSGHMGRIGLDLYLEMLEEAVARLKGEGPALHTETELNLGLTAHIPESYIADSRERLRWYKMLSSAPDAATRHDLELELRDRFGRLPEELETFIAVLRLKARLGTLQVLRADVNAERLRLIWEERQTAVSPDRLLHFLSGREHRVRFMPPAVLELRLDSALPVAARLDAAETELENLA